jgi:uncharacterized sporulation protein YeaH/YhbH (DUF444 family)
MTFIIDRRDNPRGKNHGNRQRFIRRAKAPIKEAVRNAIKDKSIKDLTNGQNIHVPVKDLGEPSFGNDRKKGKKQFVHPGNKEFAENDQIERPSNGGAGEGGQSGANSGDSEDEFVFSLTRDEFLDIFFEDLELPDLTKQKLKDITTLKLKRAGYTNTGNPSNIDVGRSTKLALARRIALSRPHSVEITELEELLIEAEKAENYDLVSELATQLELVKRRYKAIPWIDPVDVRYKNFIPQPKPNTQAVMFSIMDVSASMGEREKDIAKRFFLLLHMFLTRKYEKVEIVFIRHTHAAQEVDEHTFFYDKTTGGTIVSRALEEMLHIIESRYAPDEWNIYCAQASDGDNYSNDSEFCKALLTNKVLPLLQYMAYIEISAAVNAYGLFAAKDKELWKAYDSIQSHWDNFEIRKIGAISDIYPVFRELFSKEH